MYLGCGNIRDPVITLFMAVTHIAISAALRQAIFFLTAPAHIINAKNAM
jgi:ribosome-binding factor A